MAGATEEAGAGGVALDAGAAASIGDAGVVCGTTLRAIGLGFGKGTAQAKPVRAQNATASDARAASR